MDLSNFKLHKVMLDDIGISVKYTVEIEEGDTVVTNDFQQSINKEPHADLLNEFFLLSMVARKMLGIDDATNRLKAKGIVLTGTETKKAAIYCEYAAMGGKVKMRTPKIAYKISEEEAAADLTVIIPKIIGEVYSYLYLGKCAEMEEL